MSKFFARLTDYGAQQFAQAIANKQPLQVTHFAVGDGNGKAVQPSNTRTALFKETYRAPIGAISQDLKNHKQIIFEMTIPENVGGFTLREMGIFDQHGKLLAHANCPESYKPQLEEGSGKIQVVRMILQFASSEAVTLTVNNNIIWATRGQAAPKTLNATSTNQVLEDGHTHEIAKASTTQAGLVQLNNTLTSTATNQALTAAQGKALNDRITTVQTTANSKWTAVDATTTRKGIVQLNSAINSTLTTQAATPSAVKQAYDLANGKWTAVDATTTRKGIVQLNSAINSTLTTQAATPSAVKQAYDRASTAINNAQTAQTIANSKQSPATTLAGYGITDFIHKILTSENLNDIKKTGIYGQDKNVNATVARNYPEQKAGALLVRPSAYGFMQEYIVWDNYNRYIRNQNSSGGWASWKRIDDKVERSGDTITGNLIIDKTARNEWSAIYLKSKNGNYHFEGNPDDNDNRLNIVHQVGTTKKYLRFRKFNDGDFVAYEGWINSRLTWANIANKPQIDPNLVPLFKGEFHQAGIARNVTVGKVSGADITLTQSFKNFRYLVCVISNDEMTAYNQAFLMTSLIPVGNSNQATWTITGNGRSWSARFLNNTTIRCIYEDCVLHAIYGTNAL